MNDDPFCLWLLHALQACAPKSAAPEELARAASTADPDAWRQFLPKIRQSAIVLAREGKIHILRKGKPVNPETFKGVFRLRYNAIPE